MPERLFIRKQTAHKLPGYAELVAQFFVDKHSLEAVVGVTPG